MASCWSRAAFALLALVLGRRLDRDLVHAGPRLRPRHVAVVQSGRRRRVRELERREHHRRHGRAGRRLGDARLPRVHRHLLLAVPAPGHLRRRGRVRERPRCRLEPRSPARAAGFLWWNAAPARIFMGDTGSLALGGAMAGLALLSNVILLLPVLGGLYVIETLSVIAQVVSFRGFGRRVLRMAPIHHHFEVDRLAGVHRDRAVLDLRRRVRRAWGSASSTPTSSTSPERSTDGRAHPRASGSR